MKWRLNWLVPVALAIVGCADPAAHFRTFADEMCACRDDDCIAAVEKKVLAFAESRRGRRDPSREQRADIQASVARMKGCSTDLREPKRE